MCDTSHAKPAPSLHKPATFPQARGQGPAVPSHSHSALHCSGPSEQSRPRERTWPSWSSPASPQRGGDWGKSRCSGLGAVRDGPAHRWGEERWQNGGDEDTTGKEPGTCWNREQISSTVPDGENA